MIILGIDPGTARIGWAIVEATRGATHTQHFGCITTDKTKQPAERLLVLYDALTKLFHTYDPDCVSVEELFFSKNAKTAIGVGQARGVVLLTAAKHNVPVVSYTPLVVKQAVCGNGRAEKRQVQLMVTRLLKLRAVPQPDDVADALAIALTHAYSFSLKDRFPRRRE